MKLTKYGHACFTLEKDGQMIVIDPGILSPDFITREGIVSVIVTHDHADHFDPDQLAAIFDKNPESILLADESITAKMRDHKSQAVKAGDKVIIGPFNLEFFGGEHAVIHSSIPVIPNLGVMINDAVYYPGDSLVVPGREVTVLALPASAPWLKIGEAIDFLLKVSPKRVFPTHDGVYSEFGKNTANRLFGHFSETISAEYIVLGSKDQIDV